jgi:hypothetical protein
MPTPTYDLIASTTLAAATSEVVFGSIPQTYRDLILVYNLSYSTSVSRATIMRFNGDSGSNYSSVRMYGNGSTATSDLNPAPAGTNGIDAGFYNDTLSLGIQQIMDYSATDKHKTVLGRHTANGTGLVMAQAARWANTSALTSIILFPDDSRSFASGNTFSLYGVIS